MLIAIIYISLFIFLMWYGKWIAKTQAKDRVCPVEIARAKNKQSIQKHWKK